jgi:Zinc finger, C3HC4 type (RING finger)/Leucine Rich repeat
MESTSSFVRHVEMDVMLQIQQQQQNQQQQQQNQQIELYDTIITDSIPEARSSAVISIEFISDLAASTSTMISSERALNERSTQVPTTLSELNTAEISSEENYRSTNDATTSRESTLDNMSTMTTMTTIPMTTTTTLPSFVESLVLLLKRIRCQDPNVQWVVLERRRIPNPYLVALLNAIADNKFITKLRLHRVISILSSKNNNICITTNTNTSTATVTDFENATSPTLLTNNEIQSSHCHDCSKGDHDDDSCYMLEDKKKRSNGCSIIDVSYAIANCIRSSLTLVDLDLSKNHLGDSSCTMIAQALVETGKCSSIKRLNLSNIGLGDAGLQALSHSLSYTNVSILKLGNNNFGMVGFESLCYNVLMNSQSTVTSLDVRGNNLGGTNVNTISILANVLAQHGICKLRVLYLNKNNLTDSSLQILAKAMETNQYLQTLDLQKNADITEIGLLHFVRCLQYHNDTFTKLKLCSNNTDQQSNNNKKNGLTISDSVKQELLEWLLVNSYGPLLARKTKTEYNIIHTLSSSLSIDTTTSQKEFCVICYDNTVDDKPPFSVVLLPCKHHNICAECAEKIQQCHMCREVVVKVYKRKEQITTLNSFENLTATTTL